MNQSTLQAAPAAKDRGDLALNYGEPARSNRLPQNVGDSERVASVVGGSVLLVGGLMRGRLSGLLMTALGGSLLYRGFTGHCYGYEKLGIDTSQRSPATAVPARQGAKIERTIAVNSPAEKLYDFWSDVENLPRVMRHLKSVKRHDGGRSHWVAEGPLGQSVEWDAETINTRENELIAWRSLPGSEVETAGSVHFKPLGHGRGTAVVVSLKYNPPAGKLGAAAASLLGSGLEQKLADDLRRFKSVMEAGEAPTHG